MSKREVLKCGKSPCHSCPYRRDVPGGVWAAHEYEKLAKYDGDIGEQIINGAHGVFLCHAQPGKLCAGWVGTHDMENSFALRLAAGSSDIDPMVFDYKSPVPLYGSGAEAAAAGMSGIDDPSPEAKERVELLTRKHKRLRDNFLEEGEDVETA